MLVTNFANATIQYGAINHITWQVTVLEDGGIYTPLFWEPVSEQSSYDIHQYADANGYSYTEFPYLIESVLGFFIIVLITIGIVIKFKRTSQLRLS
jgi:hypothetical protein